MIMIIITIIIIIIMIIMIIVIMIIDLALQGRHPAAARGAARAEGRPGAGVLLRRC